MMGQHNTNGRWWVNLVVMLLLVALGWAVAYGGMSYQVSDIRQYGSRPVQDLDKRVTVLEEVLPRIERQNSEDHKVIKDTLEKIDKKIK
jgi:hypothetical protein